MQIKKILYLFSILSIFALSSCFKDTEYETYAEWRAENLKYLSDAETQTENGQLVYEKIIPDWEKSIFTLIKWHKRGEGSSSLVPLANSTVDVKYTLKNINGDTLDSSSSFRCVPCNMITGFWVAVTNMHEGDSVTAVIPSEAGYGVSYYGSILPYSTLVFDIKLDSIVAYEKGW